MNRRQLTPFGVAVKTAAITQGMTLTELAAQVGTSLDYLGLILYGERPKSKYVSTIIQVLGLPEQESETA